MASDGADVLGVSPAAAADDICARMEQGWNELREADGIHGIDDIVADQLGESGVGLDPEGTIRMFAKLLADPYAVVDAEATVGSDDIGSRLTALRRGFLGCDAHHGALF